MGPVLVMGGGVVVLLVFFFLLGKWGPDDDETPAGVGDGSGARATATPTPTAEPRDRDQAPSRPRRVRLRLVATGPVYVCLVNASGDQVIDEQTLAAGTRTEVFRSRSFRTNFGNDNVQMVVNGKTYRVAASPDPIGYSVRPGRAPRRLSDAARPDCSS
jgi:hypothetical protein